MLKNIKYDLSEILILIFCYKGYDKELCINVNGYEGVGSYFVKVMYEVLIDYVIVIID